MMITTDTGKRFNLTTEPIWNDFHKCFYAWGYVFIETRQQFSKTSRLHNFKNFTKD